MSIILVPITGGVRCSYSSTGLTLKKTEWGRWGQGEVGGGGNTMEGGGGQYYK